MKSLSLKTYSRYYLYKLYGNLRVKEMGRAVEETHHRLYPALLTYAYFTDSNPAWFSGKLRDHLVRMRELNTPKTDDSVTAYLSGSGDMDLVKFCETFRGANMRRDETELKNTYRDALIKLKKQKKLSEYRLCRMAEANPGNFHAFMRGDDSKISVKKLALALERAYEYSPAES